ncbi:MAG: sigma-70 family RNA polymerase sigma factor [Bacteroidales bacterium]|nr:sigma-70 family RNA polymerase sigma factor [Bacteroidales bacterium]
MNNDKEHQFELLVREHKRTIYTVCYMFSHNKTEVDDLFQEVLIRLWNGFDHYEGRSSARTWVYRVALTSIESWTFEECRGFTGSLVIPNLVTSIGSSAFEDCRGFDGTLTLSKNLASVGSFAFASCSGFKDAEILAETPPSLENYPFGGFGSVTLVVPCGCTAAYENSPWSEQFTNIIEDCTDLAEAESSWGRVYPNPTSGHVTIEADNIRHLSIINNRRKGV